MQDQQARRREAAAWITRRFPQVGKHRFDGEQQWWNAHVARFAAEYARSDYTDLMLFSAYGFRKSLDEVWPRRQNSGVKPATTADLR